MKILILGADSFIGRNLCAQLDNIATGKARWYKVKQDDFQVITFNQHQTVAELESFVKEADFIFDVHGFTQSSDIASLNAEFNKIIDFLPILQQNGNACPVVFCSSILAASDTLKGCKIKEIEEQLFQYSEQTSAKVLIYRLPSLFGKWDILKEDSDISTLCYNIANGVTVRIDDPEKVYNLVYIDDLVDELIGVLTGDEFKEGKYCYVPHVHRVRLGDVADLLYSFDEGRPNLQIPYVSDSFRKALYSTYTSYLPKEKISYHLEMKTDVRGSFAEFIHTENHGQVSINITKPGYTKGQHWHNTLVERFLVVSGHGLIQLRKEGVDENGNKYPVVNFEVSSDKLEVVEMIAGYTHNLINLSETEDMVTVMWANACFDPDRPDTYFDPVE